MPNIINVCRKGSTSSVSLNDEERRKVLEQELKGFNKTDSYGMEWGTVLVFSCERDCCLEGVKTVKECWREEYVLVQWE